MRNWLLRWFFFSSKWLVLSVKRDRHVMEFSNLVIIIVIIIVMIVYSIWFSNKRAILADLFCPSTLRLS